MRRACGLSSLQLKALKDKPATTSAFFNDHDIIILIFRHVRIPLTAGWHSRRAESQINAFGDAQVTFWEVSEHGSNRNGHRVKPGQVEFNLWPP